MILKYQTTRHSYIYEIKPRQKQEGGSEGGRLTRLPGAPEMTAKSTPYSEPGQHWR